jgi:hypothetical protein
MFPYFESPQALSLKDVTVDVAHDESNTAKTNNNKKTQILFIKHLTPGIIPLSAALAKQYREIVPIYSLSNWRFASHNLSCATSKHQRRSSNVFYSKKWAVANFIANEYNLLT